MMEQHAGRKHYLYSASGSDRWMNCVGSIQRAAGMPPSVQSTYAADGEEAHELLEYALVNGYASAHEAFLLGGFTWTHRHDTEQDRIDSVQLALDTIQDTIDAYMPLVNVFLEVQFKFPSHEAPDDAGGTTDAIVYSPDLDIMHVMDFKHGAGHAVEATNNSQLKFYAAGARETLRSQGLALSGMTQYELVIVQPRAFHKEGPVRKWWCDDSVLDQFVGDVDNAIRRSRAQAPDIVPGSYCRWCPAYTVCPENQRDKIDKFFPNVKVLDPNRPPLPPVEGLDVERIAALLEAAPSIKEYLAAVEQQAVALARQGVPIPRHKAVYAQARRRWNGAERDLAIQLAHIISAEPSTFMQPKLVNITEAERLIKETIYKRVGRGKDARKLVEDANAAMAQLTVKDTSGNVVVVPADDKRPEVNLANMIAYTPPKGET